MLPGSTLPASGNLNNYINIPGDGDRVTSAVWSDAGLPYVVKGAYVQHGGALRFLPGTTVQLAPGASMWADPALVEARGRPGEEVVFERFDPALPWHSLQRFDRLENCIIDGAVIGARFGSSIGPGFIDNCIIRNCEYGVQNNVVARQTRFLDNDIGVWNTSGPETLDGGVGANSFVGNGVGVEAVGSLIDAQLNWWGDASGRRFFKKGSFQMKKFVIATNYFWAPSVTRKKVCQIWPTPLCTKSR